MFTVSKEDAYYEWTDRDGNIKISFEENVALAYLLLHDILIMNNFWWRKDWPSDAQKMISFGVMCSDTFSYACADSEELCYNELEDLFQYVMKDKVWGHIVWCIKKRQLRPIEPIYNQLLKNEIWKNELLEIFNEK